MARRRPDIVDRLAVPGSKCCVSDARGKTVVCFAGPDAGTKAKALQMIAKRSTTVMACNLPAYKKLARDLGPRGRR